MNLTKMAFTTAIGLLSLTIQAQAQNLYHINFKGTCQTTNEAGQIVSTQINNKTLIQEAAAFAGETNVTSLTLVYHFDAVDNGDLITTINTNGVAIYTNLALLIPEQITNGDETQFARCVHIFTRESLAAGPEHVGHGQVNGRLLRNGKSIVQGSLLYCELPSPSHGMRVCNATFHLAKPLSP